MFESGLRPVWALARVAAGASSALSWRDSAPRGAAGVAGVAPEHALQSAEAPPGPAAPGLMCVCFKDEGGAWRSKRREDVDCAKRAGRGRRRLFCTRK